MSINPRVTFASPLAGALSPLSKRQLYRVIRAIVAENVPIFSKLSEIELILATDGEQAQLNKRFLKREGPTNVLSFPPENSASPACVSLSVTTALRESVLYGQDGATYLARLLVHGLAHLAGYEHGEKMDAVCAKFTQTVERLLAE